TPGKYGLGPPAGRRVVVSHYILVCRNNSLTISLRASGMGLVPITSLVCARILTCAESDRPFQQSSTAAPDVAAIRRRSAGRRLNHSPNDPRSHSAPYYSLKC